MNLWEFVLRHWLTVLFGVIVGMFTAGYRHLEKRMKKDREASKAMQEGLNALLADRIIQWYSFYSERGFVPICVKKSAESLYLAYHVLGGNGIITDLYNRLVLMPTEPMEIEK